MEDRGRQLAQQYEQQEQAAEGAGGKKVRSLLEIAGLAPEEQRAQLSQNWRQYELSAVCCRQNVYVPQKGKAAFVDALLVGGRCAMRAT